MCESRFIFWTRFKLSLFLRREREKKIYSWNLNETRKKGEAGKFEKIVRPENETNCDFNFGGRRAFESPRRRGLAVSHSSHPREKSSAEPFPSNTKRVGDVWQGVMFFQLLLRHYESFGTQLFPELMRRTGVLESRREQLRCLDELSIYVWLKESQRQQKASEAQLIVIVNLNFFARTPFSRSTQRPIVIYVALTSLRDE